ncbi:MAG: flagellar hook-basal body complex protein FliE [Candidatus Cybelea sp.]
MRVEPLLPDAPTLPDRTGDGLGFSQALDALGDALSGASSAEDDFAYGRGTLHDTIYERARADVALSVATATAQRIAQAVQSILNMQV